MSDRREIRSSLLQQGLPEREAVEGDAPEGAAAQQRGVQGSFFLPQAKKKIPRPESLVGGSEERQLPTLPPGGAVPSAMVSLTSLFGMGRGGSSPL